MNFIEIFSKWILNFIILAIGLIGNCTCLIIFGDSRWKHKFPNRSLYITLSIVNSIYLLFIRVDFVLYYLGYDLRSMSNESLKVSRYLSITLPPIASWLNVFNTIDVLVLFKHANFKMPRVTIISLIIAYNLIYYTPILKYSQVAYQSNYTIQYKNKEAIFYSMDVVNSTLLPFLGMFVSSSLLMKTIFRLNSISESDLNRLKNNIKLAFSSIMINLTFFVLNFPITLMNVLFIFSFNVNNNVYYISKCIYQASFCVHFYVLILFNSIFREKLFILCKIKAKLNDESVNSNNLI